MLVDLRLHGESQTSRLRTRSRLRRTTCKSSSTSRGERPRRAARACAPSSVTASAERSRSSSPASATAISTSCSSSTPRRARGPIAMVRVDPAHRRSPHASTDRVPIVRRSPLDRERGVSRPTAMWLAMNVRPVPNRRGSCSASTSRASAPARRSSRRPGAAREPAGGRADAGASHRRRAFRRGRSGGSRARRAVSADHARRDREADHWVHVDAPTRSARSSVATSARGSVNANAKPAGLASRRRCSRRLVTVALVVAVLVFILVVRRLRRRGFAGTRGEDHAAVAVRVGERLRQRAVSAGTSPMSLPRSSAPSSCATHTSNGTKPPMRATPLSHESWSTGYSPASSGVPQ